jgi:Ca2+-binding RTX toxin-like protein
MHESESVNNHETGTYDLIDSCVQTDLVSGEADSAVFQFTDSNSSASEYEAPNVIVDGDGGDDSISFRNDAAANYGNVTVDGGAGNDVVSFWDDAAANNGNVIVNGGAGDDEVYFDYYAGNNHGNVTVDGGAGDDVVSFGDFAGLDDGNVTVNGGAGDDEVYFGDDAAANNGNVTVNGGAGDDVVSFDYYAGNNNGNVTVNGGDGADTFIFGNGAENLSIDLGEGDEDVDSVTFDGEVFNTTIANWENGVDVVSVVNKTAWSGADDGTNTTFTTGGDETITFLDVTGVDLANFLF